MQLVISKIVRCHTAAPPILQSEVQNMTVLQPKPFDKFGSHLDKSNKTVDLELEQKNFKAAGEILAEVWSKTVIDDNPVVAEYSPAGNEIDFDRELEQSWIDNHVRQSRYLLQIVRCKDIRCCLTSRTNYDSILGRRFLPAPVPMKATAKGPAVNSDGQFGSLFQNLWLSHVTETKVFDAHCPKLSHITHKCGKTELQRRVCTICGIYYPTLKALNSHKKICKDAPPVVEDEKELADIDYGDQEQAESAYLNPTDTVTGGSDDQNPVTSTATSARTSGNIFDILNRRYGYNSWLDCLFNFI